MNSESQLILSLVRTSLRKIGNEVIQKEDIYNLSTLVQSDIMLETKCNEISTSILLETGQNSYPILEPIHHIFSIIPSWPLSAADKPIYVSRADWNDYKEETGARPIYMTLYAKSLWVVPNTCEVGDSLVLWGYQNFVVTEMDDDHPPEVPKHAYAALVAGICAKIAPDDFVNEYLMEKQKLKNNLDMDFNNGIQPVKRKW